MMPSGSTRSASRKFVLPLVQSSTKPSPHRGSHLDSKLSVLGARRGTGQSSQLNLLTVAGKLSTNRLSNATMSMESATANRDLSIYYIETDTGKPVRHRLDFNTPRTREAAGQIGITYEDCVVR